MFVRRWQHSSRSPLYGILLLAILLRIWAALAPGFHHPDAIFQYLEPAHRLLSGEGVITWEWRTGIRSWLLPTLFAVPLAVGQALSPDGQLPLMLPRLATGAASLGIVWAAWNIGRRHSLLTATLAAFVAATWFELVFFAAETLSEPLAVAAMIPAAALIADPRPRTGKIVLAGALFGLAVFARPHYAPAVAALVVVSWWHDLAPRRFDRRRWGALIGGAVLVAAAGAVVDARQGLMPFAWILANFEQNIVHNVSARYGTFPILTYVDWSRQLWSWWLIPAIIGVRFGWRQCPGLLAAAAVTLLLHSVIPHKEYRFVFLTVAAVTLLAAFGWGELIAIAGRRWGASKARGVAIAVFAMWGAASIGVAQGNSSPARIRPSTDGWKTFAVLRQDPAVCGVALIEPATFTAFPGTVGLRRGTPISLFTSGDPASRDGDRWTTALRWRQTFNRIVTVSNGPPPLPPGYRVDHCEGPAEARMCIIARPGTCKDGARSPFLVNRVLARRGY
ncbi:hypothetical protein [Sphingomonas endolithica]|uniref:hypothetical protein n=1 Tax=Sphingomonas endolithica TaxID=2972485 RepID=UPI0021B010C3|nr:hypothetical protein [Sphingomonas sp. ZFBP2030]